MTDARVEDSGEYECQVAHHGDMEEEMGMTFSVHVLGEILIKRKSFCNANFDVISSNAAWLVLSGSPLESLEGELFALAGLQSLRRHDSPVHRSCRVRSAAKCR